MTSAPHASNSGNHETTKSTVPHRGQRSDIAGASTYSKAHYPMSLVRPAINLLRNPNLQHRSIFAGRLYANFRSVPRIGGTFDPPLH